MEKIAVLGGGSWGTAIADLLAKKGKEVHVWCFEENVAEEIKSQNLNSTFLKGHKLSENLKASNDLSSVLSAASTVIVVVPSHVFREVLVKGKEYIREDAVFITATKGIENESLMFMSDIISDIFGKESLNRTFALSGPSFAAEVARETPTAVVVAGADKNRGQIIQKLFSTDYFRVYTNEDLTGVELCGSLKNIIAIAAGICKGLNLGHNTLAALLTRGLHEITRMGMYLDAKPITFAGLAGMGDLILTCTGELSRNRSVGIKIGQGQKLENIISEMEMVAEGVKTAKSAYYLAKRYRVELPIIEQVYLMLYENKNPTEAVKDLMGRKLTYEYNIFA